MLEVIPGEANPQLALPIDSPSKHLAFLRHPNRVPKPFEEMDLGRERREKIKHTLSHTLPRQNENHDTHTETEREREREEKPVAMCFNLSCDARFISCGVDTSSPIVLSSPNPSWLLPFDPQQCLFISINNNERQREREREREDSQFQSLSLSTHTAPHNFISQSRNRKSKNEPRSIIQRCEEVMERAKQLDDSTSRWQPHPLWKSHKLDRCVSNPSLAKVVETPSEELAIVRHHEGCATPRMDL